LLRGSATLAIELQTASQMLLKSNMLTLAALAAKQATKTIPIAFASADPVGSGLVTSLARPGGNATGLSNLNADADFVGKCLELLTQVIPGVSRVAVLWQPGVLGNAEENMLKGAEVAARALGVRLQFVEARGPEDFDRAFSGMTSAGVGALTILPSIMFFDGRRRLVDLAAKNRLPAVYNAREIVDAGGLMAYGANGVDLLRRAATYVDKILKGAKPADGVFVQGLPTVSTAYRVQSEKPSRRLMPQRQLSPRVPWRQQPARGLLVAGKHSRGAGIMAEQSN